MINIDPKSVNIDPHGDLGTHFRSKGSPNLACGSPGQLRGTRGSARGALLGVPGGVLESKMGPKWSQNRPRDDQKSIKKRIENRRCIFIEISSNFRPFWRPIVVQNDTKMRSKSGAFRSNLFSAKPTFYYSKTNDVEDRRVDFRNKNRSKNTVKTNVPCEVESRPVFHPLGVDFGTILAPKTDTKSIKNQ